MTNSVNDLPKNTSNRPTWTSKSIPYSSISPCSCHRQSQTLWAGSPSATAVNQSADTAQHAHSSCMQQPICNRSACLLFEHPYTLCRRTYVQFALAATATTCRQRTTTTPSLSLCVRVCVVQGGPGSLGSLTEAAGGAITRLQRYMQPPPAGTVP